MLALTLAHLLASSLVAAAPAAPATLDTSQPTCVALSSDGAEALYLVPREVCDSRTCKLVLELQPVSATVSPPEPIVIAEGDPLQRGLIWTAAVRAVVQEAVARYRYPCTTTPIAGPLLAGSHRYTLAKESGVWWARSDNGRAQALRRIGATEADPVVIDGHPDYALGAFARTTDLYGKLVLQFVPLRRLAAPSLDELIAKPRSLADDVVCLGLDHDAPAMLVRTAGWLARVTARGTELVTRIDGDTASYLSVLDEGCTDDALDEPTFGGKPLSIGASYSGTAIDLTVWEPRERHWNLAPLKQVKTPSGSEREELSAIFWHPSSKVVVLRISVRSTGAERFAWVDLGAKHILP